MYIVMQLLGNSLEDCLIMTKRPFSLKTIIQLGRHMISRIRAMHKKGILHLDIKPNNFVFGNRKKN